MRRYVFFILMIALGIVIGIFYAQEINPVEIVDAPPNTLRADYQADYILMVAEIYALDRDPAQAARQIALLGSDPPADIVNRAIVFALEQGYAPNDLILLRDLSEIMRTWNPNLQLEPGGGN
jgi:hypothetical protein